MMINQSYVTYKQMQDTSGTRLETISSQPVKLNRTQENTESAIANISFSGKGIMMSRLFGDSDSTPPVQTQLNVNNMNISSVNFLTTQDRSILSDLYEQAQNEGADLRYVDDLAHDLGTYRMFNGVMANVNDGTMFDMEGHQQTFIFTEADTATATRIKSSKGFSGSVLDTGFLNYELDAGYSFSHKANFDFLEAVVNGQNLGAKFATYEGKGQKNYIIETASEVTLKTEEPDWRNVNGVFTVTEKGLKNGFSLVDGKLLHDPQSFLTTSFPENKTLLDAFISQK
ncbi:hypothetical protein [Cronobacter sakazakii]|uniref:hypothetical protein n=1 Tax=Cronobacter sakazakii TaxID=28141 RepID=UPI000CF12D75|nr:hypothetical protein [Cronobacter sakazakii]PPY00286.1 hypothetical protein C3D66_17745 [Cronobacter sakazakii]